ncbi:unnamed protein product [Penicillium nalgiovense]|uniref:Uncharacterized protein n=1 Tax=Penicillium nalgiovense TaxID=60175 RepID=A0A9W4HK94_PENNA|nr:unnamed protein product [Penicillium nalgiovense]CAG7993813.1 unnamed protein product [Penicillium nalgiovense]CAG8024371.1 unnamed protein product [Penicillium nalgiovense]CAG8028669.1 unnamed protein product [Penicillium nalgiovense]CAG8037066.1 unnamed protein product [Penicillium nalgiovense]
MAESHGTPDPKFSDFVPRLKGASNWELWKQRMKIALNSKDPSYWAILIGQGKRPPDLPGMEESDVEAFDDTATEIIDDIPSASTPAPTTAAAQPATEEADLSRRKKAVEWVTWKYKPGVKPEEFVTKWRQLFTEMKEAYPIKEDVSSLCALLMFLHAVSNNTACQYWLSTVSIREYWSYDQNLHHFF